MLVAVVAAIALAAVAAWGLGWFRDGRYSDDYAVAELQRLRDEGFAKQDQMNDEQRQAAGEDFRRRMEGLTDEQRRAFFESSAPLMMQMFAQRVERFLAMSLEEQRLEMDRRIDEMQSRGGPPGGGFQQNDPQRFDQMRKQLLDWSTPEQRARFETAMTMFNQRLTERGMNPGPGGGFF
jgi:hypothetical protein